MIVIYEKLTCMKLEREQLLRSKRTSCQHFLSVAFHVNLVRTVSENDSIIIIFTNCYFYISIEDFKQVFMNNFG